MKEINIDISDLTDLKSDSSIIINIGETTYKFKPISLRTFTQYERLSKENDATDGKAFLLNECAVKPEFSIEEAEELPAGLAAVLVTNILRASFLMLPASSE